MASARDRNGPPGSTRDDAAVFREAALELLLGEQARARAAAQVFEDRLAWTTAVGLCAEWAALPQLHQRLERLGISLHGAAREKLHRSVSAVFLRSAACLHQGVRALCALADAGIDAVAIKGVAAIAMLYRGPRDRTIGDADMLIRRTDRDAAVAALARVGFRLEAPGGPDARADLDRHYAFAGNRSVSMLADDGSEIDVHVEIGRLDTEAILASARQVDVYGRRIRVVSHAHGFLLGVHHMLRNDCELNRSVRDLLDCRHWLDALLDDDDTEYVVRQAIDWGLAAPAFAVVQVLAHFDASGPASNAAAALAHGMSASERAQADALTELFLLQRSDGVHSGDLVKLLSPTAIVQFLKRTTEVGQAHYRWLMRTETARQRGARAFWTRVRDLRRSVAHTEWRLLWALKHAQERAFTLAGDGTQNGRQ